MNKTLFTKIFSASLIVMLVLLIMPITPAKAAACVWTGSTNTAWATNGNWSSCNGGGGVNPPVAGDTVTIPNVANDPIISVSNVSVAGITIQNGGVLTVNDANNRTITVAGSITIDAGGSFVTANAGTPNIHTLNVSGNITNNGTLDFVNGDDFINTTFNGSANQTVSGTGGQTDFNNITINNSGGIASIIDVTSTNFTAANGFLTLTSGTFRLSTGVTINPAGGDLILTASRGFIINHAGAVVNFGNSGLTVSAGNFQLVNGTFDIGNDDLTVSGGTFQMDNGTLTVGNGDDDLIISSGSATFAGGTATINGDATSSGGTTTFSGTAITVTGDYDITGGTFGLSAGSITVGNGNDDVIISGTATANLSGGTLNSNGRLQLNGGTTNLTGTTVNLDPQATSNLGNTTHIFEAVGAANVTFTSGTLTVIDPHSATGSGNAVQIVAGAGTKNFAGSTIQLGNGSSTTAGTTDGFDVNCGPGIGNLTINNTNTNIATRFVRLITNNCTVGGNFTITDGEFRMNSLNMSVTGNFTNNDTFTPGTAGTVTMNGAASQNLGGSAATTFYNFAINNAAGVTLGNNITLNNLLTFTSGRITTGANTVILPTTATATGNASSYVNGNVRRAFTNLVTSFTFPIGDATNFAPLQLAFGAVTTGGDVTASVTNNACGSPGINQSANVNHCWSLTNGGVGFNNYNATFNFVGVGTDADAGSTPANYIVGRNDAGGWTYPTVGTRTATSTQATGITTLGNTYEVGEIIITSLTLQKVVDNNNGGTALNTAWTLQATGPTSFSGTSGINSVVTPGNYTLSETGGPSGYSAGAWSCSGSADTNPADGLTISTGETVTCSITNTDNPPSLSLTKIVTTDNGGTAIPTAWTVTATGTGGSPTNLSGTGSAISDVAFKADTYTLGESGGPAGYTASLYSCSINGGPLVSGNSVTLGLGDSAICTITNDDTPPSLTLVKQVTNDNGGSSAASAWTLTATGPTGFSGAGPSVSNGASFDAGTYDLSEIGPAGYTASAWVCVGGTQVDGDTVSLALGQSATCTITNDDNPTTLTLVKAVVNNHGGTNAIADWALTADGNPFTSGVSQNVTPGTYTLAESGPGGYTASAWVCVGGTQVGSDITLAQGESATCTITNDDNAASLTLIKQVTNNNGGTNAVADWALTADGAPFTSGISQSVSAGTYTLAESGPSGYTASAWSCVGGSQSGSDITLALGESATCTITNDDQQASLTLVKQVTNNNGGTNVITDWALTADGAPFTSGVAQNVNAGTYTLAESGPSGYAASAWVCVGGSQAGSDITLTPGQSATCTITNDDVAASLTLVKQVTNNNGGSNATGDWTLTADGTGFTSGVAQNVNPGTYTLAESGPGGYTASAWVCVGGSQAGSDITLVLGESATCTITNDDIAPTLTLLKVITNNDGGTSVNGDWTLDASGPSTINGVGGTAAVTNQIVDAGTYSLSETSPVAAGYTNTAITCTGSDIDGSDGLDLDPGENVTCTFFNDDIGATLTLLKDVTNNNIGTAVDTDWTLTATGPSTISGIEGIGSPVTSAGVSAGNYTLTESGPANYTQTAITCVGGTDANGADGLTLALGETVTCTFFNDDDVPVLLVPNVNSTPDTGDATLAEGEVIVNTLNISQLTVQFNWDADNPAGTAGTDDVDNPNNYILLYSSTGSFNTPSCAVVAAGGVVAPDIRIPVTSVAYSNGGGSGPYISTLTFSAPLTNAGYYRLFVCGTTSIVLAADPTVALAGNGAAGTDFTRNFQLTAPAAGAGGGGGGRAGNDATLSARDIAALPATGFAPNRVTVLPEQPADLAYTELGDLWIEIPALGVKEPIVGVPQTAEGEWDVTWLANNIGWLNGTAFPSWEGNSVLTAHVTNADGLDGPFANLKKLKYGDQIIVHLNGEKYTFEVRNSRLARPYSTSFAFEHLEEQSNLTLITCQYYVEKSDTYLFRRVVRAVLVKVESE